MRKRNVILKSLLIALNISMILTTVFVIKLCLDLPSREIAPMPSETVCLPLSSEEARPPKDTVPTATTAPEPVHVIATATVGAMGDLLMHEPIFSNEGNYNAAVQQEDGSYDFSTVFQYLAPYTSALDYAAINLETTLAGEDNGYAYHGYPLFNCPDEIVDGVKDAGFDMLLTANNHSYDTGIVGFKRTLEVIRERGIETLGTYASPAETKWHIQDVNGIKIGMLCYTWASGVSHDGRPSLNSNMPLEETGICNYFYSGNISAFYEEMETYLAQMKAAGAEATILYIHWGVEYVLSPTTVQQSIAQALCNLGVDVIIGSHPHVVQTADLLSSEIDPTHKTVCMYSMGNAVSNQRQGNLSSITTAHTEDGVVFSVKFEKYSDGTVYLAEADVLPTWVNMRKNSAGRTEYNILPLDMEQMEQWPQMFQLDERAFSAAKDSYERTMNIVGSGLEQTQAYLAEEKQARELAYQQMEIIDP